jgi:prepilin-type N-terminal cleavage/methylation domain-containing protein
MWVTVSGMSNMHTESTRFPRPGERPHGGGFTLIELMVTLAVLVLLVAVGVPSFGALIERYRGSPSHAGHAILEEFQAARHLAIKHSADMFVRVAVDDDPSQWVVVMPSRRADETFALNCEPFVTPPDSDACDYEIEVFDENREALTGDPFERAFRRVGSEEFSGIELGLDDDDGLIVRFDYIRGTATATDGTGSALGGGPWTVAVAGSGERELRVRINRLGRAWLCHPTTDERYPLCD